MNSDLSHLFLTSKGWSKVLRGESEVLSSGDRNQRISLYSRYHSELTEERGMLKLIVQSELMKLRSELLALETFLSFLNSKRNAALEEGNDRKLGLLKRVATWLFGEDSPSLRTEMVSIKRLFDERRRCSTDSLNMIVSLCFSIKDNDNMFKNARSSFLVAEELKLPFERPLISLEKEREELEFCLNKIFHVRWEMTASFSCLSSINCFVISPQSIGVEVPQAVKS